MNEQEHLSAGKDEEQPAYENIVEEAEQARRYTGSEDEDAARTLMEEHAEKDQHQDR
jgi:hypothetical protein